MRKLKTFFRTVILSSISPAYYNDVVRAPRSFSLKYVVFFHTIGAVVAVIIMGVGISKAINLPKIRQEILNAYPSDLRVELKDGKLLTNKALPYAVPVLKEIPKGKTDDTAAFDHIIVFEKDTNIKGIQDVRNWNAAIVVTETNFYVYEKDRSIRAYEIPKTADFSLTRDSVTSGVDAIMNHPIVAKKWYVPIFSAVLLPFVFSGELIGSLVMLLFYTIPGWIVGKLLFAKKMLSFGTVFRIGIHSITPVILVISAVKMTGAVLPYSLLSFVYYIVWTYMVFRALKAPIEKRVKNKR